MDAHLFYELSRWIERGVDVDFAALGFEVEHIVIDGGLLLPSVY
ncbi:hypothetical protein U6P01_12215 [Cutibacterium acnes]